MTLDTTSNVSTYTGNAVTVAFATNFKFQASTDIIVTLDAVTQTENTDYTVSGGGTPPATGTVTFTTAPGTGVAIVIQRRVAYEQQTDFENFDGNPADVTELQFDLTTMQTQQLSEEQDRTIKAAVGTSGFSGTLPALTNNGEKYLRLKSDLSAFEFLGLSSSGDLAVSAYIETLLDDTNAAAARATLGVEDIATLTDGSQGEIIYRGASAWAKLGVGTSGQYLQTQGAGANPQWATLSFDYVLLATQTASSSANISFTSSIDSTYRTYVIIGTHVVPATDGADLNLDLSTDGGSSYLSTNYQYHRSSYQSGVSTYTGAASTSAIILPMIASVGSDTGEGCDFTLTLNNPSGTGQRQRLHSQNSYTDTSGNINGGQLDGGNTTTSAVDAVRFAFSSGNIESGVFKLFGVK